MGGCCTNLNTRSKFRKQSFIFDGLLGAGSFGSVWRVIQRQTNMTYALKIMDKSWIIANKCVKVIKTQLRILSVLSEIDDKFLVNTKAAFQDFEKLYLLFEFIKGRDLRHYLEKGVKFTQNQAKFVLVNLLKALLIFRREKIIHHDIKPENIMIDENGYARLADFTLAEFYRKQNRSSNRGTIGYVPPEVLKYENHDYSVDYFSLGACIYELMFARKAYQEEQVEKLIPFMQVQAFAERPQLAEISPEAKDFLIKIMEKEKENRLGCDDIRNIYRHPWINMTDKEFDDFTYLKVVSPIPTMQLRVIRRMVSEMEQPWDINNFKELESIKQRHYFEDIFSSYVLPVPHEAKEEVETRNSSTRVRRPSK